ncbi:MAG: PepSY domain-containing protein [Oscillospiraceae bacterium]
MQKDSPLKGKIIAGLSLAMVVAVTSAFALPAMAANSNSSAVGNSTNTVQATNQTEDKEVNDAANETSEDTLLASQVKITEAQAIATVEAANPNTTVTCDELGNENGTAAYQLTATAADGSKSEVKVDANTGAILSTSAEEENNAADPKEENEQNSDAEESASKNETEDAVLASQVKLSEAQAIAIVEAANPGASVTCGELGNENGTAAYELKITASDGSKSEAMVDANTGATLASTNADVNYEG